MTRGSSSRIRVPVFAKIMAPVVLVIVFTVGISSYRLYQQASERLQSELDSRLERVAAYVAETVDRSALAQLREPRDVKSPAYAGVRHALKLARTSGGLAWLGIYYREGDYLYYWVDADASLPVGYPFFYATPDHLAVFEQQQSRRVQYADEYGVYYGFAAPIIADGRVIGIVEAHVSQETRQLVQREALARALPILLIGIAAAVFSSLLITHYVFSQPLNRLRNGAWTLASGHFGYQIRLDSNDELGELADTFNRMSTQIERLHLERVREERTRREREVTRLQESERILEAKVVARTTELAQKNEELVRSQAALAVARDQALSASSAKSEFLARMSHELRTPLNIIVGYGDILRDRMEETGQHGMLPELQPIRNAARHILMLVNDVLDLSKIEAGKMELHLESINVAALVDDVARTVEPLVHKNNNTLTVRCPDTVGEMWADPTKIRQSLFNLLSNAGKFTRAGAITFEAARVPALNGGPEWITFVVSDTGEGIPPEKVGRLFQDYTQADASTSHKYGGTGLGLAITRRFCELMGGSISVQSEMGKGSTFTIQLPAWVQPVS